jgi:hypothetical protein
LEKMLRLKILNKGIILDKSNILCLNNIG